MNYEKEKFIAKTTGFLKQIRSSSSLTQETMSELIGMSKKTYIQTELGRRQLSWAETISFCCVFKDKLMLIEAYEGQDPLKLINEIAENEIKLAQVENTKTYWWNNIISGNGFVVQQNIISEEFRILDDNGNVLYTTLLFDVIKQYLEDNSLFNLQAKTE